ncbi:hypothetical protein EDD11_003699 [Mortierella claussenii]|nr:hypothetical protein EDD11_003699 [Mortierella claussenii]
MLSASSAMLHLNYHDLDNVLSQSETEHNWAAKEAAIKSLGAACHSGISANAEYVNFIKNHRKAFNESLLTERTRLSGAACELVEKLSTEMGRDFGLHFPDLFTGALLKVCARTNKVMVSRAVKALNSMINAGSLATLPKACQAFATNNKSLRIACIGIIASCIAQFSSQELEPFLAAFEPVLKEGVSDAAPEVRDTSRKSFKVYAEKFPERSQMMTATLPGNVLKYLLPDTRSSATLSRVTPGGRLGPGMNRFGDGELPRHQSSRELSAGPSRTGPSRVGPVRSRTVALTDHGASNGFRQPSFSSQHASSQPSQPYSHHSSAQHQAPQIQQKQQQQQSQHAAIPTQHHSTQNLTRNHGPASRTGSLADVSEGSGHSSYRMSAPRGRSFSSGVLNGSAMISRSPSINLATNGGPQRVVPVQHFGSDTPKSARPSTLSNRLSKVEPIAKPSRISALSSHNTPVEREQMSASERAKAYSASLKNEMANRRAAETHMRAGMGARRVTTDHAGYSGYASMSSTSVSVSSNASTASISTATSTTSVSPASSSSTSPTTVHSPNHDHLFSTFRAPAHSQLGSSPPESCPSPEGRHSTPPMSQPTDDAPLPAQDAPLSPTFMAQVSLEAGPNTDMEDAAHTAAEADHPHQNTAPAPLSPHSPVHSQPHASFPQSELSANADHPKSPFAPPSPLHETDKGEGQHFDILDAYAGDDDTDHSMSIPDHESLFGNTESYLQIEQEILELQQSLKRPAKEGNGVRDHGHFMDEDPQLLDPETEQLAVNAYAEYEAAMAAEASASIHQAS